MSPFRSIVTVAMISLASALGVAAVPVAAQAAIHAPAAAVVCAYHSGHWTAWYGNCATSTDHSCTQGTDGNITPPNYVSNACANNLDLYPKANQGGTPLCIAHDSRTHHLATYKSYRVVVGGC